MKMFFHTHTERGGIGLRANCGPDCQCHAGENDGLAAAREMLAAATARHGTPIRSEVLAALDLVTGGGGGGNDAALSAMTENTSPVMLRNYELQSRADTEARRRQVKEIVLNATAVATEDKTAAEMVPISFAAALAAKAKGEKKEAA